jgi:hypothetical protein
MVQKIWVVLIPLDTVTLTSFLDICHAVAMANISLQQPQTTIALPEGSSH